MTVRRCKARPGGAWQGVAGRGKGAMRMKIRSETYRRFVASQPCFACGVQGFSQAAHANYGKGLGLKTGDDRTFPLCSPHGYHLGCHYMHDNLIGVTRMQRRELEAKYVERMQAIARAAGVAVPCT